MGGYGAIGGEVCGSRLLLDEGDEAGNVVFCLGSWMDVDLVYELVLQAFSKMFVATLLFVYSSFTPLPDFTWRMVL